MADSGATLGKAYVQIMPSAKGIQGALSSVLNKDAESAGKSAGSLAGNNFAASVKTAVVASGIALAIGKVVSDAVNAGGALQQSIGGIETLFKESASKVRQYANEAYKTVGLSANAYMENVTGFSASLLQSLGGDTAKAADVANMAMIDMADNSNKMGTAMESIQNAYQGFAKQNYTMLDNLKLGYGGTKAEMERLLADAQKLTGVKYDITNLSDVYTAIHAIQENLEITGTTALEASSTFTGSLSAMKAALENVLGSMALGEDLSESLNQLAETAGTFLFDNLLPLITNILKALPEAAVSFIKAAIPLIVANLPDLLKATAEISLALLQALGELAIDLLAMGGQLIVHLVKGMEQQKAEVVSFIKELIEKIFGYLESKLSQARESGKAFVQSIIDGIKTKISDFVEGVKALPETAKQVLDDWTDGFKEAGANIIQSIIDGIKSKLGNLKESITGAVSEIRDRLPFSPAKKGPLKDLDKLNFGIIADRIYAAQTPINKATNAVAGTVLDNIDPSSMFGEVDFGDSIGSGIAKQSMAINHTMDKAEFTQGYMRYDEKLNAVIGLLNATISEISNIPRTQRDLMRKGGMAY